MDDIKLSRYRWPAEWEPHTGTWLSWPVNPDTWPGTFERIPAAFAKFVAAIARFEPVNVLANSRVAESARVLIDEACAASAAGFEVSLFDIEVNDAWCRDYGPIFLNAKPAAIDTIPQIAIDWDYNSWGGKYPPWDNDAAVAGTICMAVGVPTVKPGFILEGGAIDGNGDGMILTTVNCLLNPNRNPGLTRHQMEALLRKHLNAKSIVWLPGHGIIGDDTDGHIDQMARFVDIDAVVVAAPYDADAPEAEDLRANRVALSSAWDRYGNTLRIVDLPLPAPKFQDGHRLPASYCNFYIANGGVIVPTFGDPADDYACTTLQDLFPNRTVIGVDASDLIWGLGAFHCMTQQQPAG